MPAAQAWGLRCISRWLALFRVWRSFAAPVARRSYRSLRVEAPVGRIPRTGLSVMSGWHDRGTAAAVCMTRLSPATVLAAAGMSDHPIASGADTLSGATRIHRLGRTTSRNPLGRSTGSCARDRMSFAIGRPASAISRGKSTRATRNVFSASVPATRSMLCATASAARGSSRRSAAWPATGKAASASRTGTRTVVSPGATLAGAQRAPSTRSGRAMTMHAAPIGASSVKKARPATLRGTYCRRSALILLEIE